MANLGHNIIANYIGRTWTAVLCILFAPIYLKFLGIEAYGLVGFYLVLYSLLSILDFGIGATINRELARLSAKEGSARAQRDVARTLEIIYWGSAVFAGGVVILSAPYIANTWIKAQSLDPASVLKAVRLMGISVVLQFPMGFYQGGLMGLQRQVLTNAILILTGALRGIGAVLVLWLVSPTIEAFLTWQVLTGIVSVGVFLVAMWRSLPQHVERPRFRKDILYDVWKYAAATSANVIIGVVLTQLDKVILSRMLTLKMFGYYSLAATAASAVWLIVIPFNTAVFPRFVQFHEIGRNQELRILFHRSSQILSFMLFPVCAILIIFSREILFIWTHDPSVVENCYLIMSFLVFGTMLNGIVSIPSYSASAFGWPQLITYTNVMQAVVIIPLIVGMVCWLQGVGAAISWVVMNITYVIFMVPIYFRRYLRAEQRTWYLRDIAMPALAAFSICMFSLLIVPKIHTPLAIWGRLTVTGMVAIVVTGLTLSHVRSLAHSWCHRVCTGKMV